jgi:hypothetical protein
MHSQTLIEESSTVTQHFSNLSEEYPFVFTKTEEDTWDYESKHNGT